MTARRVELWTPVQSHDPQNLSDLFTHQMRPFTRHKNLNLQHNLLRKPTKTKKQSSHDTPRVAPRPRPICIPHPPHLTLRTSDRSRRQKLLHHCCMPVRRSLMQRRVSILWRAVAHSQAHPFSVQVRAPAPTPVTLCITERRQELKRNGAKQLTSHQTTMPRKAGFKTKKTKMPNHAACLPSAQPYLHPASPARLTSVLASVAAPPARSCSTTAACPFVAAIYSGVIPFCGAQQRSVSHTLSLRKCVSPHPHP